jgi:hypothetical protein
VGKDGFALQYASEELRGDREVVLKAVRSKLAPQDSTRVLQYASEELRNDSDVVLAASWIDNWD